MSDDGEEVNRDMVGICVFFIFHREERSEPHGGGAERRWEGKGDFQEGGGKGKGRTPSPMVRGGRGKGMKGKRLGRGLGVDIFVLL